jgi:hypothetical protein
MFVTRMKSVCRQYFVTTKQVKARKTGKPTYWAECNDGNGPALNSGDTTKCKFLVVFHV